MIEADKLSVYFGTDYLTRIAIFTLNLQRPLIECALT